MGASNIDTKDPRNFQLFSMGAGMLPETVTEEFDNGLKEHAIIVSGEQDGKFDSKDYILFYAEGPDVKYYSEKDTMFLVRKNLYYRATNLYLKIGSVAGKRIQSLPYIPLPNAENISNYIKVQHLEDEKVNLLFGRTVTYGSGKEWYGDYFKTVRKKDYSNAFNFDGLSSNSSAKIKLGFAARSDEYTDAFLQINGSSFKISMSRTNTGDVEDDIAKETDQVFNTRINPQSNIILNYPLTNTPSEGWLNYITFNSLHDLTWNEKEIDLISPMGINKNLRFQMSNANKNIQVWNIQESIWPVNQESNLTGSLLEFYTTPTSYLQNFFAFDINKIRSPNKGQKIPNQNLASLNGAHAIILYFPEFETAAQRLALHRTEYSKIKTIAISIDKVYNEYSTGQQDPTAIRNFARHQYLSDPDFKYLILLGDGSFDYLAHDKEVKGENFIPVYETDESLSPIYAFPSDDYYALLEKDEGGAGLYGDLDIAIGRIPARSKEEADVLIDKIINYDLENSTNDDWKLRIAYAADDEDSNVHLEQSEEISSITSQQYPAFNVQKIYLDAFKQESGAAGEVIPGANQSLFNNIYQGLLVFNYLGHGGPKGLSQEGLLRNSDVESWSNKSKLPLIITATCSFAPYDDPNVSSTGEALFRSPYGGAIALLTTVRNVYSSSNKILTQAVFETLFNRDSSGMRFTLGEIMQKAKNKITGNGFDRLNTRKFALLGDPTQRLSIPSLQVKTTKILSKPVSKSVLDTVKSLQLLKINGEISDEKDNKISNFNGIVNVTLFDKKSTIKTLGQNATSYPRDFQIQNSILFKGSAVVKNGDFEIEFVVPKDIDYKYGRGKISFFASSDQKIEAQGAYENIIIGGSQANLVDDKGPQLNVFLNRRLFKNGDITHANPLLIIDLFDDNGINATGNSIGHDLTVKLDDKTEFVLNDFYAAIQGDFRKGVVNFPLKNLTPGHHFLKVKAWDVANNSAESTVDFIVIDPKSAGQILSLSAFPNPAKDQVFIDFTHNINIGTTNKVRYTLINHLGQTILEKEETLGPSPVTRLHLIFPEQSNGASGVYYINIEVLSGGKRIDSRGVRVLRIP